MGKRRGPKVITVNWPKNIPFSNKAPFKHFLTRVTNRIIMGETRYGRSGDCKLYLSRLKSELRRYELTGNQEHLVNVANYAFLETLHPEHPRSHYDNTVKSATR